VTLSLRPEPPGADHFGRPPDARLRLLMRHMLLLYGWRVITLELPPPQATPPEGGER
jgi:hypothetical protein